MTEKISRLIVETSIVFVSIFTTLSMLLGATSNDFKSVYSYLGYMLYFALPFIFACFFGIICLILENANRLMIRLLELIQIAFFLCGLMTLLWLAITAAQTSLLPTKYLFTMPYFTLPTLELFIFGLLFTGLAVAFLRRLDMPYITVNNRFFDKLICWVNNRGLIKKIRNQKINPKAKSYLEFFVPSMCIVLFIAGIVLMSTVGVTPDISTLGSGDVYLQYSNPLNVTLCEKVNATLKVADRIDVNIVSKNNTFVCFYLLNDQNYYILSNPDSTNLDPQMIDEKFGRDINYNTVINDTGTYYFVLTSDSLKDTNVYYSITLTRVDSSVEIYYFLFSTLSASFFLMSVPFSKHSKLSIKQLLDENSELKEPSNTNSY